jgi:hypothetical protein
MREIRLSGSEGGGALTGSPYPYPPIIVVGHFLASAFGPTLDASSIRRCVRQLPLTPVTHVNCPVNPEDDLHAASSKVEIDEPATDVEMSQFAGREGEAHPHSLARPRVDEPDFVCSRNRSEHPGKLFEGESRRGEGDNHRRWCDNQQGRWGLARGGEDQTEDEGRHGVLLGDAGTGAKCISFTRKDQSEFPHSLVTRFRFPEFQSENRPPP